MKKQRGAERRQGRAEKTRPKQGKARQAQDQASPRQGRQDKASPRKPRQANAMHSKRQGETRQGKARHAPQQACASAPPPPPPRAPAPLNPHPRPTKRKTLAFFRTSTSQHGRILPALEARRLTKIQSKTIYMANPSNIVLIHYTQNTCNTSIPLFPRRHSFRRKIWSPRREERGGGAIAEKKTSRKPKK